jgi:uncharacterized surface protein with fasciclin (FAS1) repeats
MKRTLWLPLLVTGAVVLAACRQDPEPLPPETNTVADVLAAEGFSTLGAALEATGLDEALAAEGTFTVFAPTDEAFAALPEGALDALLDNPAALSEVLSYHVLSEEVAAADLTTGFRTTVQGSPISINVLGDPDPSVGVNGYAFVEEADLEADNGVVHAVNNVLAIPEAEYAAALAGANQVPPVESAATGEVTATLEGTMLSVDGTYEGLTVTDPGAHIHGPAGVENNADVLFPLAFDNEAGTLSATLDLATTEDPFLGVQVFNSLIVSLLYANLHTEENPSGEIRGQLLPAEAAPAPDADFTAALSGAEQVPPVETEAQGSATATLDDAGTTLTLSGSYTGLSSALQEVGGSAAHIHEAPRGENGPVVVPLTITPDETDPLSGTFAGTATIGEGEGELAPETLAANGYYINIHTVDNPDGELRGQITPVPTDEDPVDEPAPAPTSR